VGLFAGGGQGDPVFEAESDVYNSLCDGLGIWFSFPRPKLIGRDMKVLFQKPSPVCLIRR